VPSQKKLAQTDAIFDRLKHENGEADASEDTLRLSLDAKASVKIGLFSRGGRTWAEVKASDHDFKADAKLTPFGILLPRYGELSLYFASSALTSDFIVDVLEMWWQGVRGRFPKVRTLLVNQDNGPENSSRRTQYVKRLTAFAGAHGVRVRLACYPPYHSKYNPIERCWGALEQHWSGSLLDSIPTALRFARTMTWKGKHPMVELISKSYSKGVRLSGKEMKELEKQIERLPGLDKWFVSFCPASPLPG
jgi:Rhodopirellula transposase DDE domain